MWLSDLPAGAAGGVSAAAGGAATSAGWDALLRAALAGRGGNAACSLLRDPIYPRPLCKLWDLDRQGAAGSAVGAPHGLPGRARAAGSELLLVTGSAPGSAQCSSPSGTECGAPGSRLAAHPMPASALRCGSTSATPGGAPGSATPSIRRVDFLEAPPSSQSALLWQEVPRGDFWLQRHCGPSERARHSGELVLRAAKSARRHVAAARGGAAMLEAPHALPLVLRGSPA